MNPQCRPGDNDHEDTYESLLGFNEADDLGSTTSTLAATLQNAVADGSPVTTIRPDVLTATESDDESLDAYRTSYYNEMLEIVTEHTRDDLELLLMRKERFMRLYSSRRQDLTTNGGSSEGENSDTGTDSGDSEAAQSEFVPSRGGMVHQRYVSRNLRGDDQANDMTEENASNVEQATLAAAKAKEAAAKQAEAALRAVERGNKGKGNNSKLGKGGRVEATPSPPKIASSASSDSGVVSLLPASSTVDLELKTGTYDDVQPTSQASITIDDNEEDESTAVAEPVPRASTSSPPAVLDETIPSTNNDEADARINEDDRSEATIPTHDPAHTSTLASVKVAPTVPPVKGAASATATAAAERHRARLRQRLKTRKSLPSGPSSSDPVTAAISALSIGKPSSEASATTAHSNETEKGGVDSATLSTPPPKSTSVTTDTEAENNEADDSKLLELSNSLSNLKWGFKKREESLLEQLENYKSALQMLYISHQALRTQYKSTCGEVCSQVEHFEELMQLQEEDSTSVQELQEKENRIIDLEEAVSQGQQRVEEQEKLINELNSAAEQQRQIVKDREEEIKQLQLGSSEERQTLQRQYDDLLEQKQEVDEQLASAKAKVTSGTSPEVAATETTPSLTRNNSSFLRRTMSFSSSQYERVLYPNSRSINSPVSSSPNSPHNTSSEQEYLQKLERLSQQSQQAAESEAERRASFSNRGFLKEMSTYKAQINDLKLRLANCSCGGAKTGTYVDAIIQCGNTTNNAKVQCALIVPGSLNVKHNYPDKQTNQQHQGDIDTIEEQLGSDSSDSLDIEDGETLQVITRGGDGQIEETSPSRGLAAIFNYPDAAIAHTPSAAAASSSSSSSLPISNEDKNENIPTADASKRENADLISTEVQCNLLMPYAANLLISADSFEGSFVLRNSPDPMEDKSFCFSEVYDRKDRLATAPGEQGTSVDLLDDLVDVHIVNDDDDSDDADEPVDASTTENPTAVKTVDTPSSAGVDISFGFGSVYDLNGSELSDIPMHPQGIDRQQFPSPQKHSILDARHGDDEHIKALIESPQHGAVIVKTEHVAAQTDDAKVEEVATQVIFITSSAGTQTSAIETSDTTIQTEEQKRVKTVSAEVQMETVEMITQGQQTDNLPLSVNTRAADAMNPVSADDIITNKETASSGAPFDPNNPFAIFSESASSAELPVGMLSTVDRELIVAFEKERFELGKKLYALSKSRPVVDPQSSLVAPPPVSQPTTSAYDAVSKPYRVEQVTEMAHYQEHQDAAHGNEMILAQERIYELTVEIEMQKKDLNQQLQRSKHHSDLLENENCRLKHALDELQEQMKAIQSLPTNEKPDFAITLSSHASNDEVIQSETSQLPDEITAVPSYRRASAGVMDTIYEKDGMIAPMQNPLMGQNSIKLMKSESIDSLPTNNKPFEQSPMQIENTDSDERMVQTLPVRATVVADTQQKQKLSKTLGAEASVPPRAASRSGRKMEFNPAALNNSSRGRSESPSKRPPFNVYARSDSPPRRIVTGKRSNPLSLTTERSKQAQRISSNAINKSNTMNSSMMNTSTTTSSSPVPHDHPFRVSTKVDEKVAPYAAPDIRKLMKETMTSHRNINNLGQSGKLSLTQRIKSNERRAEDELLGLASASDSSDEDCEALARAASAAMSDYDGAVGAGNAIDLLAQHAEMNQPEVSLPRLDNDAMPTDVLDNAQPHKHQNDAPATHNRKQISFIAGRSDGKESNDKELENVKQELVLSRQSERYHQQKSKNLQRERDLLRDKLQQVLEEDTASFGLKVYAMEEELSLSYPTKTMAVVMSFVDYNNKQLDTIDRLNRQLQQHHLREQQSAADHSSLARELQEAERHNKQLAQALRTASVAMDQREQQVATLEQQIHQLTDLLSRQENENRLLRAQQFQYPSNIVADRIQNPRFARMPP